MSGPHEIDRLFDELCELSGEEQRVFLEERVPDPDTRARLERLLRHFAAQERGEAVAPRGPVGVLPERIGRYAIRGVLGSGGMGIVYLAEQSRPQRRVAVKVVRGWHPSQEEIRRFALEVELLGRLQHPGIAQVYEAGTEGEGPGACAYLAMEYVDGVPLTDFAEREEPGLAERVRLLVAVARAVQHAHARGVIHRDLKPSNILVQEDGQVKVIDFGVARAIDGDGEDARTRPGQVLGTPSYMSPEQIRGDVEAIDTRSDVYALGVVAYELLAGRLPHDIRGLTVTQAAIAVCEREPARLGSVAEGCRGDLEWIVARALEKDPERRYPSAAAFAADLERYLAHEPVEARPASTMYQLRKIARRHRAVVVGIASTLFAILAGTAVAVRYAFVNSTLAKSELAARQRADRNAAEARELARLAQERASEIRRRADPGRLMIARREAEELWPALPSRLEAMDAWLRDQAEPLRESLADHQAALGELRTRALPYGDEDRARNRSEHPVLPDLEKARELLASISSQLAGRMTGEAVPTEREISILESGAAAQRAEIARLEEQLGERWVFRFEDPELQSRHDHLASLVGDLRAFFDPESGTRAAVLRRREEAATVEFETVTGPEAAAEWAAAIEDVATREVYAALALEPCIGLRPLRVDPRSGLWEFWHPATGERPVADPAGGWRIARETGLVFVLLPGGHAWIGRQADDPDGPNYDSRASADSTLGEVEIAPFFVSKYEMTQAQWYRATGEEPSTYAWNFTWYGSPARAEVISANTWWNPVESISWEDARRVVARLALALPTVAEWEYAARGGTATVWCTGDDASSLVGSANLADPATRDQGGPRNWFYEPGFEDGWVTHAPVGSFAPNPFGLHDVIGNVWEWTDYQRERGFAVARGGSYQENASMSRPTVPNTQRTTERAPNIGLRPVLHLE